MVGGFRFLLFLFLFSTSAAAKDLVPAPLAGVGSLERAGRVDCSAVLIAPALVATAAHCVAGKTLVTEGGSYTMIFHTGNYPGHPGFKRNAVRLMPHPLYLATKVGRNKPMGADMALIALDEPIPDGIAHPIPIGEALKDGEMGHVASYPGGKGERARERKCRVFSANATLARIACKVVPGESGAPVLRLGENGPEVAAIITGSSTETKPPYGLVLQADMRLGQLQAVYNIDLP